MRSAPARALESDKTARQQGLSALESVVRPDMGTVFADLRFSGTWLKG